MRLNVYGVTPRSLAVLFVRCVEPNINVTVGFLHLEERQGHFGIAERLTGREVPLPEMRRAGERLPVEETVEQGCVLVRTVGAACVEAMRGAHQQYEAPIGQLSTVVTVCLPAAIDQLGKFLVGEQDFTVFLRLAGAGVGTAK